MNTTPAKKVLIDYIERLRNEKSEAVFADVVQGYLKEAYNLGVITITEKQIFEKEISDIMHKI